MEGSFVQDNGIRSRSCRLKLELDLQQSAAKQLALAAMSGPVSYIACKACKEISGGVIESSYQVSLGIMQTSTKRPVSNSQLRYMGVSKNEGL